MSGCAPVAFLLEKERLETTERAMEKTVEREELSVLLRDVGGGREAPGVRTEREGVLSSVRVSARVPSSQLDGERGSVSFLC